MAGLDTWDRTSNATAWQALLGDRYGAADVAPYAAAARATDLSGLPRPTSRSGPPRPSGTRAWPTPTRSGGPAGEAELHVWPGAFHGFDTLAPQAALSRDAQEARTRWLRRILAR